ncbi:M48 family metalloprotease [Gloeothece verrucosa]|uniref:Peptidase M48 Ste24p n=1 Tax=Gloeothece verrucosa (strain PCC 7822) TaxID=497965 RepID=E0U9X6_GLOV7|nr:M48 family metalloprotease [Gloeothece verrucosa]ADN15046.1 peptidase M48 Ste24p [Gloeothece verrucosa PCC 7822]
MPTYTGISSNAFRHPLDQQAEASLRSLPGFDILAKSFSQYLYERPQHIFLLGNNIKVTSRQYPTLYGIYTDCIKDLDIAPEPILYVGQSPYVNAYSLGNERPYIVIDTALLDLLQEDEIRTVLAHELGHIKCDHSLLTQMALWVMGAASMLGDLTLGLGKLITTGMIYAFYEWRRKAELSADRAALLVMDDLNPIMRTMMKLAGGTQKYGSECSLEEFIRQADEYQNLDQDSLNQLYKFLIYNGGQGRFLTHPFAVERVHYLRQWAQSEQYYQIRQGNYARSQTNTTTPVETQPDNSEVETLRRQIEELQAEIERVKSENSPE